MRHPAYNLKVNKDADRLVLIETVRRILHALHLKETDYKYWGFGGPFLEDLKLMHSAFPNMPLLSIEKDVNTVKRQEFHRFINNHRLELIQADSTSYIRAQHKPDGREIVWLDYTVFGKREINDFIALALQLPEGSVIKVTFCAQFTNSFPPINDEMAWGSVYRKYRDKYALPTPDILTPDLFVEQEMYAKLMHDSIIKATKVAFRPPLNRYFQPLVSTVYKDETQMLSITGAILSCPPADKQTKVGDFFCDPTIRDNFNSWDLSSLDGNSLHLLDVPAMSNKERLSLQKFLPFFQAQDEANCISELPHLLGNNIGDHEKRVRRYASLAPYYSHFGKITV